MTGTIMVRPADGARVVQPDRAFQPIPPEGALVVDNSHYRRAILTGDLIEIEQAEAPEAAPDPAAAPGDDPSPERRTRRTPSSTSEE